MGDGGKTWRDVHVEHQYRATCGQASPVVLKSGRILLPFNVNNYFSYYIYSDDDGETWSERVEIPNVRLDKWVWVAFGPPASLLLESGRIVIPSYHSYVPSNGLVSYGHMVISDDDGK